MPLLTLAQAKSAMLIDGDDRDLDAQMKLDQAEAHVLRYLKKPDRVWSDDEKHSIRAAIILTFGELFDKREQADLGKLFALPSSASPGGACFNLLNMLRDPALA